MAESMQDFVSKLTEFLKSFDDGEKVISEEAVQKFFKELEMNK